MIKWNRSMHGAEYNGYTEIQNNRYMVFEIMPDDVPRRYYLFGYIVSIDDDGEMDDLWKVFSKTFRRIKDAKEYAEQFEKKEWCTAKFAMTF